MDKRVVHGRSQYLVKWENYSSADNTWEPLSNLKSVLHLVEQYDKKVTKNQARAGIKCKKSILIY